MNVFETKQQATEYANSVYPEYLSTGVANIVKAGPLVARILGCAVGFYVDIEKES